MRDKMSSKYRQNCNIYKMCEGEKVWNLLFRSYISQEVLNEDSFLKTETENLLSTF